MDGSVSPKLDSDASEESELKPTETRASKRRKVVEKTVVTVKIGENGGKLKNEGPPPDSWSWRKYGQKPIKGSPYPRGYYRCSTSKGCSAKKQVERCRTDASMLIITYTSSHNHPGPDLHITNRTQLPKEPQTNHSDDDDQIQLATPKEEKLRGVSEEEPEEVKDKPIKTSSDEDTSEEHFHYLQSPLSFPQNIIMNQDDPLTGNLEKTTLGFLLDEEPLSSCPHIMTSSTPKLEENDFFDELEELPISSAAFTSFMRSKFFDEGIPVVPS